MGPSPAPGWKEVWWEGRESRIGADGYKLPFSVLLLVCATCLLT